VETVKPYWHKFLARFPTVADLAAADLQEVLKLWAGLGYYRRARHLYEAAGRIVADFGGKIPENLENLMNLPGIGRYTAGAVASIAFGAPVPVVDGNVVRVLARLTAYDRNIADPKNAPFFWQTAAALHQSLKKTRTRKPQSRKSNTHGNLNEALMELGATVCTPANPSCLLCPVRDYCRAFAQGRQLELPVKAKKPRTPVIRGIALVIVRTSRVDGLGRGAEVLLMQRPADGLWAEMWEFPVLENAKFETRSTKREVPDKTAMAERVEDEIGLRVNQVTFCAAVRHQLTHRLFTCEVVRCSVLGKSDVIRRPMCLGSDGGYAHVRWVAWPLKAQVPVGRIVGKVAEAAMLGFR
jgi:A/G-specific adenine glycosylase